MKQGHNTKTQSTFFLIIIEMLLVSQFYFIFSEQRGLRPFPLLGEKKIASTLRSCHVIVMNLDEEIKAVKHRLTPFFFSQKQFSIINSTIQS